MFAVGVLVPVNTPARLRLRLSPTPSIGLNRRTMQDDSARSGWRLRARRASSGESTRTAPEDRIASHSAVSDYAN
eukprot:8422047-Pyramimonas_sp.AAC.1